MKNERLVRRKSFIIFLFSWASLAWGVIDETELKKTQAQIQKTEQSLVAQQSLIDQHLSSLKKIEQQIHTHAKKRHRITATLHEQQAQLQDTQYQLQHLRSDHRMQLQSLKQHVQVLHQLLQTHPLQLLLEGRHDQHARLQWNYQALFKHHREYITSLQSALLGIQTEEQHQQALLLEIQETEQTLQKAERDLQESFKKRKALLAHAKSQQHSQADQLNILKKQETLLIQKINTLKKVAQSSTGPFPPKGKHLHWPLSSRKPPNTHSNLSSAGHRLWLPAPEGQTVFAIHPGTVVFSGWLRGFGNLIIVDHGQGYMSLYGHQQSLLKEVGDVVLAKEPLGLVGQSGGQSKPGLYFEIRKDGKSIYSDRWFN